MTSRFSSVSPITTLRAHIRRERRALSRQEQLAHAEAVAHHLAKSSYFRRAKVIAVYLDTDGELMTAPLIREARRAHKTILLPVLHPFRQGRLIFREWQEKALLELNRFHILEPTRHARRVELRRIDLVITPLVAIDMHAMRIGMGGGYYDRTFAFRQRFHWRKPLLVGVAHSLQIFTTLPQKKYDVLLDAFVSEKGMQTAFHKKK
jgi:5-formyltetrahydrofolate cyclo-ligase